MRLRAGILFSAVIGSVLPIVAAGPASAGIICQTIHTGPTCELDEELFGDPPPPPNDDFANSTNVVGFPKTASGTTLGATVETGEPAMCAASTATVWFEWTADVNRDLAIDTFLGGTNTVLAVYTGSAFDALTLVGCNDDATNAGGPTTASEVNFSATAGTTYQIQVGWSQGAGRSVTLHVTTQRPGPPANDALADAVEITALPFATSQDTRGATYSAGESTPAGVAGTLLGDTNCGSMLGTVWYTFTAAADGFVRADTKGSTLAGDPMAGALAVWRQEASGRSLLACNFDTITGKGTIGDSSTPVTHSYDLTAVNQSHEVTQQAEGITVTVKASVTAGPVYTPPGAPVLFEVAEGRTYYLQAAGSFGGYGDALKLNVRAS